MTLPTGLTLPYSGTTAPDGWLFAYGQTLNTGDYPALFAALGFIYLRGQRWHLHRAGSAGKIRRGQGQHGGTSANRITTGGSGIAGTTLGAAGGGETATLSTAQIPTHTHALSFAGTYASSDTISTNTGVGGASNRVSAIAFSAFPSSTGNNPGGGGATPAHANVQPTIVLNYIIKT